MNQIAQSQMWLDTTLYPFKNNYISLSSGQMHYADEGEGEIILFVHGTPTWSFLYRDFIKDLSKDHRCIAIDHLGFGLSEKPINFDGKPESHAKNLTEFIKKLDLVDITIIVHDFGGPIGLGAAIENHLRIKRVVLLNSWLWATKEIPAAQKVNKIISSEIGEFLYLRLNFSPKILLKKGFYDKNKLKKNTHRQYIQPFPTKSSRLGLLNIGKSLVGSSDWYQEQWEKLDVIKKKPWLILWGMKDDYLTPDYLQKWKDHLPNAQINKLECGHFIQEEKSIETINAIDEFVS